MEFRALGPDGILFYSANGERQSDFLACYLLAGKVKCRFSAGSGIGDLVSTKTYNDQRWHKVSLVCIPLERELKTIRGIRAVNVLSL